MKKKIRGKFLLKGISISMLLLFFTPNKITGQSYPDQVQLPNVNYETYQQPGTSLPGYLETFTESLSGSSVTRITDRNVFNVSGQRLRHNYSRDQTWNSDETLIKMAGYPAAILDAETYEFLYWSDIPSYGRWSHTQPNIMYGTDGNTFVSHDVNSNQRTVLHRFSNYASVDFGFGEGNQDKFDRYVGLIGKNGNNSTLIVYDIQNNVVTGTKDIGTNGNELDWFSVSQLGGFAVAQYKDNGTGPTAGIKSYNINMTNEQHIYHNTEHGDLGVDAYGNEVIVEYGGESEWNANYSLYMARLDGQGVTKLFPYINGKGIWGGHISTQNVDRPGWAYISEQCCPTNPVAPAEIFAIKLDGSGTIERYGKHNAAPSSYLHETQVVPNRNGTKMIFASNWNDSAVMSQSGSPSFVLEYPQVSQGMTVNAGNDVSVCEGQSTNLTAYGTGGTNFTWSTGETTQNIEVTPSQTTTYTVTLTDNSGNSVTDEVVVTVNSIPVANAGEDVTINEGESVTLTATGGDTFLWNTTETSASIAVSPTVTTTYTVQVIRQGCSSEDTVVVSVSPTPITADAGDDTTICEGASVTLTASGGSDYEWSTGETSQSITVNPTTTTNYTVTVSNGQTSASDSVLVTVNPLPTAHAGSDITITEGESTILTATGGTSYLWNTGETTSSISVSPLQTTTYSVQVTENNCSSEAIVTVVVEGSSPTVTADAGEDVTICENASTTLTASGGSSYEWSTGETTQSIEVNPTTTTTYTVLVSDGNTSDSDSVVVTVNALPNASAGYDVTITEGESITLNASGGTSYLWNTGDTSQNLTVSPTETTTYSVTVTENNCSNQDSVTVFVNPEEPVVEANAGDDVTICENASTTLTASGGSIYEWSTGETTQSITVNPLTTTTYTVHVSEGNVTDSDTVVVTVSPLPNVVTSDDPTIEFGQYTTLSASGGTDYLWSTGETTPQISVSPTYTSIYTVTVSNNGCARTENVQVNVVDLVNADAGDDVEICADGDQNTSATLRATGGLYYEWSTGETTQSITVSPEETTEYEVMVSNGFNYETDRVNVIVNQCLSAGEPEIVNTEMLVFPNPATSEINVKVSGFDNDTKIYIYDMLGRLIQTTSIGTTSHGAITKKINVSNLPRGMVLVTLNQNGVVHTKKIVLN
ncbi:T9SS type A sorting domain-containing protein [Bizionia sp.]|uniref:T9SS type A sorting domain-containing protein n=1 Tax=Bizionia sp. TaxID=1954480 RepID=UPI003A901401